MFPNQSKKKHYWRTTSNDQQRWLIMLCIIESRTKRKKKKKWAFFVDDINCYRWDAYRVPYAIFNSSLTHHSTFIRTYQVHKHSLLWMRCSASTNQFIMNASGFPFLVSQAKPFEKKLNKKLIWWLDIGHYVVYLNIYQPSSIGV